MIKRLSKLPVLLFWSVVVFAQTDTVPINERDFMLQAIRFSPTAENGLLQIAIKNEELNESKGSFEPKLGATYDKKNFEGKSYYDKINSGIKVKTPLGVKVSGGVDDNSGVYLNPESTVPMQGLAFAGIEIPLGAGMFTDSERTMVKQKRTELSAASLVYEMQMNDYALQAGQSYWNWYGAILQLNLALNARERAQKRFALVQNKYSIGEAAGVDTLESYINLQNREMLYFESLIKWQKAQRYVNNFVWDSIVNSSSLFPIIDSSYAPEYLDAQTQRNFVNQHPLLTLLSADSLINALQTRLAREYLKPTVDLSFKLQEYVSEVGNFDYQPNQNHYVGMRAYIPLMFRKERAKVKQLGYKSDIIENKKREVLVKLTNGLSISENNSKTLKENIDLLRKAQQNYFLLLEAEQTKFNLGESSLFILNSREIKWIEARNKYIKAYVDYRVEVLRYFHALGILHEVVASETSQL